MAVPRNALKKWEKVRVFALGLPDAVEEFPWGGSVAKVNKKVSSSSASRTAVTPWG